MSKSFFKFKWQKILFITAGALLVLALVAAVCINSFLAPKLSDKLKEAVLKGTDSLYNINFNSIDLDVLQGRAVLYGIVFKPDTAVYNKLKKSDIAPPKLYALHADRLLVSDVHLLTFYFKNKLNIGHIAINTPRVVISTYAGRDTVQKKDKRTLYQKIAKTFKEVRVGEIVVTNINYKEKDYTGPKPSGAELKEMDVKATDFLIDAASQTDTSRFLYCRDVSIAIKNYSSTSADGLYSLKVKSVKLSTQTKKLTAAGLYLTPADVKTFFAKSKSDRFMLHLQSIVLNNFDYNIYRQSQSVDIKKMVIDSGAFEVTSNYNGILPTTDRLVTFPNWAIRNTLPTPLNIDTLDLQHVNFVYTELNKKPNKFGHLKFSNISGRMRNLTNRKELLKQNNRATANITSYFMGKAKLDVQFIFNLADANYSYAYKGRLAPMNMADVNPVLMPLSLVKITSGRVKSFNFDVNSTQKVSKGTVSLLYKDLYVDVLRPDYSKNTLLSTLANTVVLKHDNPDDGSKTPRLANVVYIRPANFPFFKTVWFVLLNGIKSCAGIGPAQQKKLTLQTDPADKKEQEKIIRKAVKDKEKADEEYKKKLKEKQQKNKKS